jgi:uncharacterized protein (TIGR02118 family)
MSWYDDLDSWPDTSDPVANALREAVRSDDRQLFDRALEWPLHTKHPSVVAEEKVILEGNTTPTMVKLLMVVARAPGLNLEDFFQHWYEVYGQIAIQLPGIRRYVQNHGLREAYVRRAPTHDGWSEFWFDDLGSMRSAAMSSEWRELSRDASNLFAHPTAQIIARERIQKWEGHPRKDFGAVGLSEGDIRARLEKEGYVTLAKDTRVPGQIKDAVESGHLAVWTDHHIVTIDSSRIDARPDGMAEKLGL